MEEILHHMGCIKPCKSWDKLPINRCRISAIHGIFPVSHLICWYFSFFTAWYVFHGVIASSGHRSQPPSRKTHPSSYHCAKVARHPDSGYRAAKTNQDCLSQHTPGIPNSPKNDSQLGKGLGICWNGGKIDFFTLIFGLLRKVSILHTTSYHIIPYTRLSSGSGLSSSNKIPLHIHNAPYLLICFYLIYPGVQSTMMTWTIFGRIRNPYYKPFNLQSWHPTCRGLGPKVYWQNICFIPYI